MLRALGWLFALVGALLLFCYGVGWAVMARLLDSEMPQWGHAFGVAGALLIGLWMFLDWGALSNLNKDQTALRSLAAGFATLLALAVGITGNVVSHKYPKRWDFTETKRYTLSQQSIDIAKALDREVEVMAFFPRGMPDGENFQDLVNNYAQHTTLLKAEFHDPYSDPLLAQEMKILSTSGTIILKSGENTQRLESDFDEEAFTNALIKVTATGQHSVCVVTGHGELDSEDEQTEAGIGIAALKLEGQNYKVSRVSLLDTPPSPETCKVLVVASPRVDLLALERDRLVQYVAAGGGLIVMLDPLMAPDTAADLQRLGVKVGNDAIIETDPNRQLQGADATFVVLDESSWDIHPITSKLRGMGILKLVRSVGKGADIAGLNVQVLAHSSEQSWGETSLSDRGVDAQPDAGADIVGNVPLMVAVEVTDPSSLVTETPVAAPAVPSLIPPSLIPAAPVVATPALPRAPGGKVVVVGDADFANNQMLLAGVNQDILMNSVAWMVGEGSQISIRANEAGKGKLTLSVIGGLVSGLIALIVAPGIAILAAVGMWMRRRAL